MKLIAINQYYKFIILFIHHYNCRYYKLVITWWLNWIGLQRRNSQKIIAEWNWNYPDELNVIIWLNHHLMLKSQIQCTNSCVILVNQKRLYPTVHKQYHTILITIMITYCTVGYDNITSFLTHLGNIQKFFFLLFKF